MKFWNKWDLPANTGRVRYPRGGQNKLPLRRSSEAHSFSSIPFAKQCRRSPRSHLNQWPCLHALALPCLLIVCLLSFGSPSSSATAMECGPLVGPFAARTISSDHALQVEEEKEVGEKEEGLEYPCSKDLLRRFEIDFVFFILGISNPRTRPIYSLVPHL